MTSGESPRGKKRPIFLARGRFSGKRQLIIDY